MEWTNQLTLEFINIYKKEPCIWNPKDPSRRHRKSVLDAWERVANAMSVPCTVEELKRKKESIMAIFRSICQKERAMIQSGENLFFQPNWFAFKALSFLKDIYRPKPPNDTECTFDPDVFENSHSSPVHENSVSISENYEKTYESQPEASTSNGSPNISSRIVAKKRKAEVEVDETHIEESYSYNPIENITYARNQKDICSMYADLLAVKLRRFNEDTRDFLMHEIDNLVYRTKIGQRNVQQCQQNTATIRTCFVPAGGTYPQQVPEETVYVRETQIPAVESSYVRQNSAPPPFLSQDHVKEEGDYV